jgi:HTH-type transcriptional regulator, sugar sensing transcriptional regulator
MSVPPETLEALVALGFTALEAEVYVWLLGEAATTGYRIAQGIGKPVANTYKAIESLQHKGAVLVQEDENRMCRAVPAEELLRAMDRSFAARRAEAARSLARVARTEGDDRVYTLGTLDQVMERARTMLSEAREVVLVDAFPRSLDAVMPAIAKVVARGVRVAMKVYRPTELRGAEIFTQPNAEQVLGRWPGEWLNLVVDGAQHMLCLMSSDLSVLHQAIWSGSPYLSWVYHSALSTELVMAGVQVLAAERPEDAALRTLSDLADDLLSPEAAGYRALMRRFGLQQSVNPPRKKARR